jgi:hypothetical protein
VTTPLVLHIVRPYGGPDEYLAAESWSMDTRGMLLVDQAPLPLDTAVMFDVTLGDGSRPIKAEARVTGIVAPDGARPGGLRVRFKRYGGPTKAFLERAATFEGALPPPAAPPEASEPLLVAPSSPEIASAPNAAAADEATEPPANAGVFEVVPAVVSSAASGGGNSNGDEAEDSDDAPTLFFSVAKLNVNPEPQAGLSTLRARSANIETPPNREYLLEKLRQRGQTDERTSRYLPTE